MIASNPTFSQVVATLPGERRASLEDELSDKLREVVAGVRDSGKTGKLTLVLDVSMNGAQLEVGAKVTEKVPRRAAGTRLFYADAHNNLVRRDPNQPDLPLGVVGATDKPLAEVNHAH